MKFRGISGNNQNTLSESIGLIWFGCVQSQGFQGQSEYVIRIGYPIIILLREGYYKWEDRDNGLTMSDRPGTDGLICFSMVLIVPKLVRFHPSF
jgi:hypothetical protein